MNPETQAAEIVARLNAEYQQTVGALRGALKTFLAGGPPPDPEVRSRGAFVYPELRLTYRERPEAGGKLLAEAALALP